MQYFNKNTRLSEIIEKYPKTLSLFISKGFSQMADENKRKSFAKNITLGMALSFKKIDYDTFANLLIQAIEANESTDISLNNEKIKIEDEALNIIGILPCPVRLPLLEEFNKFKEDSDAPINFELKAASMGIDWVEEKIKNVAASSKLPDLIIAAGFDLFFDNKIMAKLKAENIYQNQAKYHDYNSSFNKIGFSDPDNFFTMVGAVPAIFLVNIKELGDIMMPKSWADLLKPEFEKRVSLPVNDFVLFHSIILNIHKLYGEEGLRKLGKSLLESLSPAQMLKSDRSKAKKPLVTIMPYFFTKMADNNNKLQVIWPKEGAIVGPLYLLAKNSKQEKLEPIVDFFTSKKIGEVLSHQGRFPSVHPELDNRLSDEAKFLWPGWDYIKKNDIPALIRELEDLFYKSSAE